jgi:phosphoribosyl-ATP pyrophosphohydrolase/phosphoribosyl-AMP cyclohydrolase
MLIKDSGDIDNIDWGKCNDLVPAIVQDDFDGRVLMQAWMTPEALHSTLETGLVTFFSRSRNQLWTKGETSGNTLRCVAVHADCDRDSLLVLAEPSGPTCHRNTQTCFDEESATAPLLSFVATLERLVEERHATRPGGSYTTRLFEAGTKRIAQKVGEEGVETALAAMAADPRELTEEAADLLFHLLVLLRDQGLSLADVTRALKQRHGD